jgi:glutamate synthase (ferredoxin)
MTGGSAYVLDESDRLKDLINLECDKELRRIPLSDSQALKDLIGAHHAKTGSARAAQILAAWEHYLPLFWQVAPCEVGSQSAVGYNAAEKQTEMQPAVMEGFVA